MNNWSWVVLLSKIFSMLLLAGFSGGFLFAAFEVVSHKVKTGEFDLENKKDRWTIRMLSAVIILVIVLSTVAFVTLWRL